MVIRRATILEVYLVIGMATALSLTAPHGKRLACLGFLLLAILVAVTLRRFVLKFEAPTERIRIKQLCSRGNFAAGCMVSAVSFVGLIAGRYSSELAKLRPAAGAALFVMVTTLLFGYLLARDKATPGQEKVTGKGAEERGKVSG